MPNPIPGAPIDPNFPKYVYASKPLVEVFKERKAASKTKIARVFIGEWMNLLDDPLPETGRIRVKFRGGEGFIDPGDVGWKRLLEVFFVDVSQGDGILIQTPDDRRVLIDGGQSDDMFEFIQNKYRLDKPDHYIDFDAVVATHSDADHTQGLIQILKDPRIAVKRFYHNGLFRRTDAKADPGPRSEGRVFGLVDRPRSDDSPALTPLMKRILAAVDRAEANLPKTAAKMNALPRWNGRVDLPSGGFVCQRIDAADGCLPPFSDAGGGFAIEVVWPAAETVGGQPSYRYYENANKTVNGNSVVLMVKHGRQRLLLTGDLNAGSMRTVLDRYRAPAAAGSEHPLRAEIYKAAHHGSQDFLLDFLKSVQPDAAVISSGDDKSDDFGHPRAVLLGTVTRFSKTDRPAVFSTELAACYSKLSPKEMKQFNAGTAPLYERAIRGIVHLRSDGDRLYLGTVHGRKDPDDPRANVLWKWDLWPE